MQTEEQVRKLDKSIAPYVRKAKKTYPQARRLFLAGLPNGDKFYVTIRLHDNHRRIEQAFLRVISIEGTTIRGEIASDVLIVTGFKVGDLYSIPESEILDWTISHSDGTEQGNFVGKFLDTYHKDP